MKSEPPIDLEVEHSFRDEILTRKPSSDFKRYFTLSVLFTFSVIKVSVLRLEKYQPNVMQFGGYMLNGPDNV